VEEYYRQDREIPCLWRNLFYLEWFSEINGRILIEAAGYKLKVSDRVWDMDEDLEEAQKLANMNAMRDFMAQVIGRIDSSEYLKKTKLRGARTELNEFEWEARLKESDRLTDAYQEVLEKYMDDPDAERKEAFVMGWDGLLSAMADREEDDDSDGFDDDDDDDDDDSESWQSADDDNDGIYLEDEDYTEVSGQTHPLQNRAHEIALRSFDLINTSDPDDYDDPGHRLTSQLMQISAKLAGVINGRASGYQPEAGFVLAVLKRCLNWINEAIGACNQLIEAEVDPDQIAALEHLRIDVFEVRDGIIELRRELKQS
jgi:hypothetical protein